MIYGLRARLLHRLNLHHTRTFIGPEGRQIVKCDWCGIRGTPVDFDRVAAELSEAARAESVSS